ncbi:DUF6507 family protein [Streptomyces xanthochromogenes]|uniref:DUF6507 family protein n=1 Tax=Streptomyces xanthochromogenes TaxID=67384 RepID=UPI00341C6FA7
MGSGEFAVTGWDVSPSGVQGALRKTAVSAGELSTAGTNLSDTLPRTATAAGTVASGYTGPALPTGPVGAALGEFMQHWQNDLQYVVERTAKSLTGAAEATGEYAKGDLKMAADAQRAAVQEPIPAPPGFSGKRPGSE